MEFKTSRSQFQPRPAWAFVAVLILAGATFSALPLDALAEEQKLTLTSALQEAFSANPEIGAAAARADAEHSAIRSQYWLENPRLGFMRENNLNLMEQEMGPMGLWSVTQEIQFPAKYFLMGSAQKSRALSVDEELAGKRLSVRSKVISSYYNLFATDRILALLEAQRATLREVARAAESRRATGAVPQQDEMKAHVEQTKLESEIILTGEDRATQEAQLNAALNRSAATQVPSIKEELPAPELKKNFSEILSSVRDQATQVKQAQHLAEEASTRKSLSYLAYAPDFMLSYRRAFQNAPSNAYSFGVEVTIPLWFATKQSSEVSQASARALEAEKNVELAKRSLDAEAKGLAARVTSHAKLLEIYQTALIPQATSTLNSSRTAYQAGRTGFLELLDSERSLYETRIAYYRNLAQYVDSLARLEEITGASLSSLPFGDQP